MKKAAIFLLLTSMMFAQSQKDQEQYPNVASGTTVVFYDRQGSGTITLSYVITGSPSAMSIAVQGCDSTGTVCATLTPISGSSPYTSTSSGSQQFTGGYANYKVTPTFTGGSLGIYKVGIQAKAGSGGGGGGGGASFPSTPGIVYNTSTTASRNATGADLQSLLPDATGNVIADGTTYATIQAAYTAACALSPNRDVYVPANSTVTDTVATTPNYLNSTCTSQVTDGRSGATFGAARSNALFQSRYERLEYHPREAEMKLKMIELARNGANLTNMGIPAVPQWIVLSSGDSVNQFANQMTILQRALGLGVAGYVTTAAHSGTQNNNKYYGLNNDAFGLNSSTSGTVSVSGNGAADPTSPNGSSMTLGSAVATGTLNTWMVATNVGTDTTFRTMPVYKLFYLCDGHGALNISYSPDAQNFFSEPVTWTQPSSCASTGSIVAVGIAGVGSGTCTADITLSATGGGGSGFTGIGHINSTGGVSWIEVTAGGSGYDPYTTTIARSGGGTCSVSPTFQNILTSNMSIQTATLQHDGIGYVRVTNQSGSSVKVFAWEEYDPTIAGVVYEDLGFGGTSIEGDFAGGDSYLNSFYQAIPAPDTVLIEYLDNAQIAGHPISYWVQQWNTRANALQANKASTLTTQSTCEAAGNWWNLTGSVCNAYTPDLEWISSYTSGFTTDPSAARDIDRDAMNAIEQINRGGGNAYYVDISYPNASGQEFANRRAFGSTDQTHVGGAGQAYLNSLFQMNKGIPDQNLFENRAQSKIRVGQGSATQPAMDFVRSGGHGFYIDTASTNRMLVSAGTLGVDGAIASRPQTIGALTSYIPNPGSTSATYAICALNNLNLNPLGCSPDLAITTGPTTLSSSNYIQVCLPNTIPGATTMSLVRKSGYTGALVVQSSTTFSNATTPTCMYDTGQSGSAYSAASYIPSGGISINGPTGNLDPLQVLRARVFDGGVGTYSDAYLERGSIFGTSHGIQWKVFDNGNISNTCSFHIGASTSWGFQAGCNGTQVNAQFSMLQPLNFQPNSFTNSTIRIQAATSNYTGTIGAFEFRSSAASAAPSGGALIHINSDSGYGGYLALLRGANTAVFGVKQSSIELFNNTANPITTSTGSGANLLRSTGTLTDNHIAYFSGNQAVDSGITTTAATARGFIAANTGTLTSVVAGSQYSPIKVVANGTLENIVGTASVLTGCTTNPTFTLEDCGTSAGACASPTALGSVTISAANTLTDGTITSATLTAGHYLAWETTAGVCTSTSISGSAEWVSN